MQDLTANLTEFVRLLRHSGLPVGPGDGVDALRALAFIDLRDRAEVYLALRSVLAKRVEDFATFDAAFRTFFEGEVPPVRENPRPKEDQDGSAGQGDEGEAGREGGYSEQEVLLTQDLATLEAADQEEAAKMALKIARRLALRLSRRRRRTRRGARIDIRATVRRSSRFAGLPLELLRSRRKTRPANLVLLLDVSGSMELYSRFLLQFVHALQAGLRRTWSFCFATRLAPVTDELREAGYELAVLRARRKVEGWGGGTRIGECLSEFRSEWAAALLSPRTAVIILSDGLDTGHPDLVANAMADIRRRAGRIIWLNPLAGDVRYQPLARGMAAALPHLDLLAPGHSFGSLLVLERELAMLS